MNQISTSEAPFGALFVLAQVTMQELEYQSVDITTGEVYSQVDKRQDERDTEWHQFVEEGQQIVQTGDDTKWELGRLACRVSERWNRSAKTIIKFAGEINMDRPRRIYELHEVAEFFPESAVCVLMESCPSLNWSKFRSAYRRCKSYGWGLDQGVKHLRVCSDNNMNCETFDEYLRKLPKDDSTPATNTFIERKRTPCEIINHQTFEDCSYMDIVIRVPKADGQAVIEATGHQNSIAYLGQRWEVQKI